MSDQLIASLRRAVAADPDDLPLRLHLADLLIGADRRPEAVEHLARVLQAEPAHAKARTLMRTAIGEPLESTVDWKALEDAARDPAGRRRWPGRGEAPARGGVPGYSGADLAHLCESAAEYAMYDSITSGEVRMIGQGDFDRALRDVRPSIGGWLATARNAASFANDNGVYDELAAYLKRHRHL